MISTTCYISLTLLLSTLDSPPTRFRVGIVLNQCGGLLTMVRQMSYPVAVVLLSLIAFVIAIR